LVDDPSTGDTGSALLLMGVLSAALAGTALVWIWLARRRRRIALLPYQPRRPVPWQGWDVLVVAVFCFLALQVAGAIVAAVLGPDEMRPLPQAAGPAEQVHPALRALRHGDLRVQLAVLLTAVLIAPVAEEFFFRVLLQGWLEAAECRHRRQLPTLRLLLPHGGLAVIASSLVFARLHARVGTEQYSVSCMAGMLAGQAAVNVLTLAFALVWVRARAGATVRDLGWAPEHLGSDVRTGLLVFAAVAVPIYAIQIIVWSLLPEGVAPDPVPLFFFALALGIVYYRTHRIVPAIVLHMALNATSLMIWLAGVD